MNIQRMIKAAEWMLKIHKAGDKFDISSWRGEYSSAKTYEALHKCGSSACFGGWLAVSPDFKRAGGTAESGGYPIFNGEGGYSAIGSYFGSDEASDLADPSISCRVYRKPYHEVTALDVAEKLLVLVKHEVANG